MGYSQERQRQRRGGFVSQTKFVPNFASLLVSYSSEHGNSMTHILAHLIRQDKFRSVVKEIIET